VIEFNRVPNTETWLVDRAAISTDSTTATELRAYLDAELPLNLLDGSIAGNLDVADNNAPWRIPRGRKLLLVWTGASAGAVASFHGSGRIVGV
jgi:hypothetical protein